MLNKLNNLSFLIGFFFTLVSLILFGNLLLSGTMEKITAISASGFFIFGIAMMFAGKK